MKAIFTSVITLLALASFLHAQGPSMAPMEVSSGRPANYMAAQTQNPAMIPAPVTAPTNIGVVASTIGTHLVKPSADGRAFVRTVIPNDPQPQYYLFYYSAGWCGPCHAFTPQLVGFYNDLALDQQKRLMVIFVSQDQSERAMLNYMVQMHMPWPAIAFSDIPSLPEVVRLAGPGIPCMVMVNRNFAVVVNSFNNGNYTLPQDVLSQIMQKLTTP